MANTVTELLKKVTWERLEEWAGSRSMQRGERYQRGGRVNNVRLTPQGAILANVKGSKPYVTLVTVKSSGRGVAIESECSCPMGRNCKHSVAAILAFTVAIKENKPLPMTSKADPDLEHLKKPKSIDLDDDEYDDDDYENNEYDDDDEEGKKPMKQTRSTKKTTAESDLSSFLHGKSKKELEELVLNLSKSKSNVRGDLLDQARLASGDVKRIVASLRRDIANITSEPSWHSHWSDEGELADFSRVEKNMKALLSQQHYEAVIQVADELLKAGTEYVEMCNDDGDSASQISDCLDIGFKAVSKINWKPAKKLLWAIEADLNDQYELCNGSEIVIKEISDREAWSEVADTLFDKLHKMPRSTKVDEFDRNYKRDSLTNQILNALQAAGRTNEILPLCEKEARITGSWQRYVEQLIVAKKKTEARKAAEDGIKHLGSKWPGITDSLRETIAKLAEQDGDFSVLLTLRQNEFYESANVSTFKELLRAASKSKQGPEIRAWAMHFLETGKLGSFVPERGIAPRGDLRYQNYPSYAVLINIAIDEKEPAEVLRWYELAIKNKTMFGIYENSVAQAIEKTNPDRALVIWLRMADYQIKLTNPNAYETAVGYLKHAKNIMIRTGKSKEWDSYLANLREANRRKPRCLQELRKLSGERILS
jgi:uncharacterized Zn finger protein